MELIQALYHVPSQLFKFLNVALNPGGHSFSSGPCMDVGSIFKGSPSSLETTKFHEIDKWGDILEKCWKTDFPGMGLRGVEIVPTPCRSILHASRTSQLPYSAKNKLSLKSKSSSFSPIIPSIILIADPNF